MIVHASHLKDDHLFECYFAARAGEPLDPRVAEHLGDCAACDTRYDQFRAFMDGVREDADTDTDALFTDDHLRGQQQQILHRLQHVQRSARVITFPGRESAAISSHATLRVAPRWMAAAAAACVCVGVGFGAYVGPRRATPPTPATGAVVERQAAVAASPAALISTATADVDDDAFLVELELALGAPHTRELQPFDALTPHVRDIDYRER